MIWIKIDSNILNSINVKFIMKPHNIYCKYFGTNFEFKNNVLLISCSIPYPFYDYDSKYDYYELNNKLNKILIYSIEYNDLKNDFDIGNINFKLNNIINPTFYDRYFGSDMDLINDYVFIAGTGKIYQYSKNNTSKH